MKKSGGRYTEQNELSPPYSAPLAEHTPPCTCSADFLSRVTLPIRLNRRCKFWIKLGIRARVFALLELSAITAAQIKNPHILAFLSGER